jgi:hypothetical protein
MNPFRPDTRRLRSSPSSSWTRWAGFLCLVGLAVTGFGAPRINEFLASNSGGLTDEDGSSPDWIELFNPGPEDVELLNWSLTDSATNLTQWRFPPTTLPVGGHLVVFASGKNRRVPGRPLHTNFRLNETGEYLALVAPDGTNVVSEVAPAFRPQFPNISFGVAAGETVPVLAPAAPLRAFVPTQDIGNEWRQRGFDDSTWIAGTGGAGFETAPADYVGLIGTDLRAAMSGLRPSAFVRIPFVLDRVAGLNVLRLRAQFDDGFAAWINGTPLTNANAPAELRWDSLATADNPDGLAVVPREFDVSRAIGALAPGTNLLAVQLLNVRPDSSDALIRVALEAERSASSAASLSFFPQPTPGAPNRGGVGVLGPILRDIAHAPASPASNQVITVTARITRADAAVGSVALRYRVMFGAEQTVAMTDDGLNGDATAGDGLWTGRIPSGTAAGLMVRYRIEAADTSGRGSRWPLFPDPTDSEQWLGLVIADPSIRSRLGVVHLFVEDVGASEGFGGTRCSLLHEGEFYDNVAISLRGQSSAGFPKKSHNLDFTRDHRFKPAAHLSRVKDIKLLTNFGNKSRLNNTLAYEVIAAAGGDGHFGFPVRVQRNGAFHGILDMLEDADDRWLERLDRNPDGALYKVYDSLANAGAGEKKTRRFEGNADLGDLIANLGPSRPLATRAAWAWDNIDLPGCVSYCVGIALVSSQDHGHKNFYVYRDTPGSGDWTLFPWDVDLTFGRNWLDAQGYFTDTLFTNNVLNFYNPSQQGKPANRFYDLLFANPDFRRMYLRRLRTVMDTLLLAPGRTNGFIEQRIAHWIDLMAPTDITPSDATLDETRWRTWGTPRTTRQEAQRVLDIYLPGRRQFLFNSPAATLGDERIPAAQPAQVGVRIDQLEFRPASGNAFEEFVRLTNAEPFAVDVSGWKLRGEVRHTFRPGTVIPAQRTLHAARNARAFRARTTSPRRGESVFVQGDYDGQLSARGGWVELIDTASNVVSRVEYAGRPTAWQAWLRLSELMFHPPASADGSPFNDEDFEFIELANRGPEPLDLTNLRLTDGVVFSFTNAAIRSLPAGGRLLLARDTNAFAARYGTNLPVVGPFYGALGNDGDRLRLEDAEGEVVFEFRYRPAAFPAADGSGPSIEITAPDLDPESTNSWRISPLFGGTPGYTAWPPLIRDVRPDNEGLAVRIGAEAGRRYVLERNSRLAAAGWERASEPVRANTDGDLALPAVMPPEMPTGFLRAAEAP